MDNLLGKVAGIIKSGEASNMQVSDKFRREGGEFYSLVLQAGELSAWYHDYVVAKADDSDLRVTVGGDKRPIHKRLARSNHSNLWIKDFDKDYLYQSKVSQLNINRLKSHVNRK